MEVKKNNKTDLYTIGNIAAIIICVLLICIIVNGVFKQCSSPVEKNDVGTEQSDSIKSINKDLIKRNKELDEEYEEEYKRISTLDNDSTLKQFYKYIGK